MSPVVHVVTSGVVSAGFAYFTHSWSGTLVCFLSGIFIDLDHYFDYWIYKKKISFNYNDLYVFCSGRKEGRLYLIFHSYELFALMWILWAGQQNSHWLLGMVIGTTIHFILDLLVNPVQPLGYSFCYRWKTGFRKEFFYTPEYFRNFS